jgi:hypothetical protein
MKYIEETIAFYSFVTNVGNFLFQIPKSSETEMPVFREENGKRTTFSIIDWSKRDPYQAPELFCQLILERWMEESEK